MTMPAEMQFCAADDLDVKEFDGVLALTMTEDGKTAGLGRKLNGALRKSLTRLAESAEWEKLSAGAAVRLAWPGGVAAQAVLVAKLARNADPVLSRKAGAALAKLRGKAAMALLAEGLKHPADFAMGATLRDYAFTAHRTEADEAAAPMRVVVADPAAVAAQSQSLTAITEGVFFTRDLVNEPANVLTTSDFAARLVAMADLGLEVEVLEEKELRKLGMNLLLAVGEGSASPSKVVIMRWKGGKAGDAPLALVGKGVVFDTGGISIKPAAGMEDMTGDMGGAGTVAGVMRALALSKAKANVVGIVGLVENMPSGSATRPGDVVRSMKGDTVEIINTDAEGRLVLADILWHVQQADKPRAIIDMATLTGAILVSLGTEKTGVFSNDRKWAETFIKGCDARGEGAWLMPCDASYDKQLKSRVADVANVGGRMGGSITAARFLARFVEEGTPWMHLDIAGTAFGKEERDLSPKGGSGWGVLSLTQMIAEGEI